MDRAEPSSEVLERASRVRFVLLDVDGVLTDGRIYVFSDGTDGRGFHARDGLGIRMGQHVGLLFGILSGRRSQAVANRADELSLREVHQGVLDKKERFLDIARRLGLSCDAFCYVGDDIVDVPVLEVVGLAVAPLDAEPEARAAAHWVTSRRGGEGAVREVVDLLLRSGREWGGAPGAFPRRP